MKITFLCQRADTKQWEEVDEYVWERAGKAVLVSDTGETVPRYMDNQVRVEGESVEITGSLTKTDLGNVCRMLGIKVDYQATGYMRSNVEFVKLAGLRGNVYVHEIGGGEFSKKVA